ncbi:MAG: hypothetical protein KDK48_02275 [Chlamydiia bacterium]|nr:hypothetical protein [Chlamydiia bacterium]
MNIVNALRRELTVDATLVTGTFYFLRATVSEAAGARFLIGYGLICTGADRLQTGRVKLGGAMVATGAAVMVHLVASDLFGVEP